MKKKKISFEILLLIVILALHAYVAFSPPARLLNWFQTDDAFYYFVTARNIAEGRGITFDGLSATNGFHPLWMLICTPIFGLAKYDLYLPLRVIIMVLALLNAATGILLYRFFAKKFSNASGIFVAAFWTFTPTIHELTSKLGLESGLTAFALVAAISYLASFDERELSRKNVFTMSMLAALLLFSRLDTIFIVVIMGIWLVFRKSPLRWQILLDGLFAFLAAIIAYYLRVQNTDNIFNFLPFFYIFIVLSLLSKVLSEYFFKGYIVDSSVSLKKQIIRSSLGVLISTLFTGLVIFLLHDVLHVFLGFPRAVLLIDFGISLLFLIGWRVFYILYMRSKKRDFSEDSTLKTNGKTWGKTALSYFGPIVVLLIAYMLINKSYAGSYLPISGTIKRWWGTLPLTVYGKPLTTLNQVLGSWFDPSVKDGPWWMITAPVNFIIEFVARATKIPVDSLSFVNFKRDFGILVWALALILFVWVLYKKKGFIQKAMRDTAFLPLFVGCVFHLFNYKATGYLHAKYWYWIPEILCTLMMIGIVVESVLRRYRRYLYGTTASYLLVGTVSIVLVLNLVIPIVRNYSYASLDPKKHPYWRETKYIEDHTEPGDVIGMTGGGVIAYFIDDRTIVNLDGLINGSEYYEQLKNAQAYQYLDDIGLDYVYAAESMILESDPYGWIFNGRLTLIDENGDFNFYRYVSGVVQQDINIEP
ncbi:MAG TPA: hypothetical protein DCK95_08330 [Anaerolineaceae bacterium]|nr:hypothetical protein [Anaerolineaceae bacterium]